MHPLLQERRWIPYALAWLPVCGMLMFGFTRAGLGAMQSAALAAPLCAFFGVICMSPWYLCRYNPLEERRRMAVIVSCGVASVAAAGLWVFASRILASALGAIPGFAGVEQNLLRGEDWLWSTGALLFLLSITLHYLLAELERVQQAQHREVRAATMARDAELRALRQQVNPHFLFNSLNSISALTSMDTARARQMCVELADFFRLSLSIGEKKSIPVAEELALARHYLAIERIRFAERLRVEEDVDPEALALMIPPLMLQPLVENAVKHGVAQLVDGGLVRIIVRTGDTDLMLAIENDFDPEAPCRKGAGMGLENVRKRLNALYAGGARLDTRSGGNLYQAEIRMLKVRSE